MTAWNEVLVNKFLPRQTHVPPSGECSDSKKYLDWMEAECDICNEGKNIEMGKNMIVRLLVITIKPNIITCSDLHYDYDSGLWILRW